MTPAPATPTRPPRQPDWLRWASALLVLVLLLRLLTLGLYPLTDTTEARYAEMARKMLESGNWLTPMFDVGVPFWGKPPLSFWLSALPMGLLGVNEFGARLGPLVAALATLALFWHWPQRPGRPASTPTGNALGIGAALVFLSTPLGFIASSAVMTDMAMVAGTTLSMVAFWRAVAPPTGKSSNHSVKGQATSARLWPWLFFAGQALGLMAKGPVAVVLSGLAIVAWVVWHKAWRATWQRLPWLRGSLLVLLLVAPWYLLAEQATPGFLRYFLVGEHWYRFTQSGWKGDLYGVAHAQPKGRIWLFALVCTLPWLLAALAWRVRRAARRTQGPQDPMHAVFPVAGERAYLLCWALAPCVFFTLSGNILPAYVLPGLPAFALLVAGLWQAEADRAGNSRRGLLLTSSLCALLAPLAFTVLVLAAPGKIDAFSDKALLQAVPPAQVAYLVERPASGVFYTQGQARLATTADAILRVLADPATERVLLPPAHLPQWQAALQAQGWRESGRNGQTVAFGRTSATP